MEQDISKCRYRICLDGRMTSETIDDIRSDWVREMATHSDMVIDLSGVECIDLAGLQLMLHIKERAKLAGNQIDFIGVNPAIDDAMQVFHKLIRFLGWENGHLHVIREEDAA